MPTTQSSPTACVPCPAGTLEVFVDENLQPDAAGPGPSSVGGWDRLDSFEQTRWALILTPAPLTCIQHMS